VGSDFRLPDPEQKLVLGTGDDTRAAKELMVVEMEMLARYKGLNRQ
jgi:hypothetical protein